jgi:hypothetical protein
MSARCPHRRNPNPNLGSGWVAVVSMVCLGWADGLGFS